MQFLGIIKIEIKTLYSIIFSKLKKSMTYLFKNKYYTYNLDFLEVGEGVIIT